MAYSDTPTDKWVIEVISKVLGKVLGKKGVENITTAIIASGAAGKLITKIKNLIGDVKTGVFTDFINWASSQKIAAREAGQKVPSWGKLFTDWYKTPKGKDFKDMTKGEKIGYTAKKIGQAMGLIGAVVIAADTINTAVSYGSDDRKREDKSTWQWIWDTSIPGATVNMVAKWFGHGRKKTSTNKGEEDAAANERINSMKRAQQHPMTKQGYSVYEYEQEAAKQGVGPAPTNPQAYQAWKKEVEMRKRTNYDSYQNKTKKTTNNDVAWYDRGEARKISAGTLTWSAVKTNSKAKGYPFVAASAPEVSILMPLQDGSLHPRVKQNINVLFQALRGKNTGTFNYTEEDVFNYVYCLSTLIARIRYLQKVLRLANVHDVLMDNIHVALTDLAIKPTLTSGATYTDIVKNAPNYISRLNSLVEEINTYALPANSLISRWNYVADKGFKDYNGPQAIYCFYKLAKWPKFSVSSGLISVDTFESITGTLPFNSALTTLETDVHVFRTLGQAGSYGTASNVMVKISGDMIKLLGAKDSTFKNVEYYTGNPAQTFGYDVEAIDQLRNAKLFKSGTFTYGKYTTGTTISQTLKCVQSGTYITTNFVPNNKAFNDGFILTTERNIGAVGPENVQLVQFFWNGDFVAGSDSTDGTATIKDSTVTIIERIRSLYYTPGALTFTIFEYEWWLSVGNTPRIAINGTNAAGMSPELMCMISQLDYLPKPEILADTSGVDPRGQSCDVDNFAYISKEQFRELNNVAAYSLTYYFNPSELNINGIIG